MTESECELAFEKAIEKFGPMWHVCTPGDEVELLCLDDADYRFAVSNMALSAVEAGIHVLVDTVMGTHIHALVCGQREACIEFVERYRYRLMKYLKSNGRELSLKGFHCDDPIPITDLKMARNEVCYIARNGYLEHQEYTPFTYPWGNTSLLFNSMAYARDGIPYSSVPSVTKRFLERRRPIEVPSSFRFIDGMIHPRTYSDYRLAESFFRDAHQYFSQVSKNWEAYSEIAKRLGDSIVVSYEELAGIARLISNKEYSLNQPSALNPAQKLALAKVLHNEYHASNMQIRSILKLSINDVNTLFPPK